MIFPEQNKKILRGSAASSASFSGFTLFEVLVAISIFLVVITLVVQIFLMGMSATKRLFGRQSALDTGRFVLESMSKEIRMSNVSTGAGDSLPSISIKNSKGCDVIYAFSGTAVTRRITGGAGCSPGAAENLSSNNVEVTGSFWIGGAVAQKRVTMVMTVKNKTTDSAQQAQVNLQTTVSSRSYGP